MKGLHPMPTFPNVLCVGMHFRGGGAKDIAAALTPGDTVRLEREPENQFDAYAIKVLVEDMHIGYIERGQAAWISPLIDDGDEATAVVTGHEERKNNLHPVLRIEVE
jgi:hypothetical protein